MSKFVQKYGVLLALAILFLGPLVAAAIVYHHGEGWISKTTNRGQLIKPPVKLQHFVFKKSDGSVLSTRDLSGRWLMLYIDPEDCGRYCEQSLYKMRQVRLALGKNRERVQRMVVTSPGYQTPQLEQLISHEYAGTRHIIAQVTGASTHETLQPGALYIVDPRGNIMLRYTPDASPEDMFHDLKILVRNE